eukprot:3356188-Pyramimonas_sp.AAC.1
MRTDRETYRVLSGDVRPLEAEDLRTAATVANGNLIFENRLKRALSGYACVGSVQPTSWGRGSFVPDTRCRRESPQRRCTTLRMGPSPAGQRCLIGWQMSRARIGKHTLRTSDSPGW